ncbi:MAG: NlpC/P60 family protein [Streptosporangiaceae bacterium]
MERSPYCGDVHSGTRLGRRNGGGPRWRAGAVRPRRAWGRLAVLAGAVTMIGAALPAGVGGAASGTSPGLARLEARANRLSNEIDNLGQQYDGLKIQLSEARSEIKIAEDTALRDARALAAGEAAVGRIAAMGYMTGGINPTIQLLQSSDPQTFLNRASIMVQLQQENGDRVTAVATAEAAAGRAELTATQERSRATRLIAGMHAKVAAIQAKENVLNSAVFTKALAEYRQTGHYPTPAVHGDSIGVQALRYALTRLGDPYVWGAAGPNAFDCSGLVMWAYAHVGISLEHYTGDQWNEGEHIPRSQLEPGDLVFFFPDIGHVGMYVGHGLMVDAPTYGQPVQIQPVFWSAYVGAVRIVA